jgi:ubiquinone/menaquinone biosynthesis C-methylase UbiE
MYEADYYKSYIGDGSWRKSLAKRSFFYRAMAKLIFKHQPSAKNLVEVGCGIGMFTFTLADTAPALQIIASDLSDHALAETRAQVLRFPNVTVKRLDAQSLGISSESTQVVTAFDVLEHLPVPKLLITEAFRVLEPGGIFVFSTPNPQSFGARVKRVTHPPGSETSPEIWFALRDSTHISIHPISVWRTLCHEAGFHCVSDGSDFWWDTPYFRYLPLIVQKIIFNGSYRLLTRFIGYACWTLGENYIGIWRKP